MDPKNLFVLDTSALLTLRSDEPGADRVADLLLRARRGSCRLLASHSLDYALCASGFALIPTLRCYRISEPRGSIR
jgi:hypothetical protein